MGVSPLTTTSKHITLTSTGLDLATANVSNQSFYYYDNNVWATRPLINQNREIVIDSNGLRLSQMGAISGQQLTWDGTSWVPSRNETVSYLAGNGIQLTNNTFKLADNLSWANNTFTIGSNTGANFVINRLTSSLTNPIQIKDENNNILTEINAAGQLSIGYNGVQNGYSIASNGFNLFAHSIARYQSAVGTTNIGSVEFGPTLLIQSVPTSNPIPSRSIVEVLDINGESRFEIQEAGYVGIKTGTPQATLDINGFTRLKKYSSEPDTCNVDRDGAIALTSQYTLCACKGSSGTWVNTSDGSSSCSW